MRGSVPRAAKAARAISSCVITSGPPTSTQPRPASVASATAAAKSAPWTGLSRSEPSPKSQTRPARAHREDLAHVRKVARGRDHRGGHVRGPERGHELGLRVHQGHARHRVGMEDVDVGEAPHSGPLGLVQQVQVRPIVDIAIPHPVVLPGDAQGRDGEVHAVHEARQGVGPGVPRP